MDEKKMTDINSNLDTDIDNSIKTDDLDNFASKDTSVDIGSNYDYSDMTDISSVSYEPAEEGPKRAKKKRFALQTPIIIATCIVLAAVLSYFVFMGFILKEPEGVIWSQELEGATYYFDFKNDNTFKAYVGSIEIDNTYQKTKTDDTSTLTLGANICNFYAGSPVNYEITGSRLLGNQVMNCSYEGQESFSLNQTNRKDFALDLPENFTPDEDLLGTWIFQYYGYDIYKVTFNDDGSIKLQFIQDGITYNGTYTIEDGNINFTYYVSESIATPLEYSISGDTLNFLGATFVREGTEATADQMVLQTPSE